MPSDSSTNRKSDSLKEKSSESESELESEGKERGPKMLGSEVGSGALKVNVEPEDMVDKNKGGGDEMVLADD